MKTKKRLINTIDWGVKKAGCRLISLPGRELKCGLNLTQKQRLGETLEE